MKNPPSKRLNKAAALGLSLALAGGLALIATPANAAEPVATPSAAPSAAPASTQTYMVSGGLTTTGGASVSYLTVELDGAEPVKSDQWGNFSISDVADGTYDLTVSSPNFETQTVSVTVAGADAWVGPIVMVALPEIDVTKVTVTVEGTATVGSVLTAKTAGWPAGTTLSFEWGWNGGQMGGGIEGATSTTYTVTDEVAGRYVVARVVGTLEGFAPTAVIAQTTRIPSSAQPSYPAPAATSDELATLLTSMGVTPQSQASTGLPAGDLDPTQGYTANVAFDADDSFADAFLYSSPISVGTFAVVDGVVQVKLSAEVLGQLEAGSHTLVVVGQNSGTMASVNLTVAAVLAETGFNGLIPAGAAAMMLLLGAAFVVVRRRQVNA